MTIEHAKSRATPDASGILNQIAWTKKRRDQPAVQEARRSSADYQA
jgi:hypothetical protein